MKLPPIGTKAILLQTNEEAEVLGHIDSTSVLVKLIDSGYEIPMVVENLVFDFQHRARVGSMNELNQSRTQNIVLNQIIDSPLKVFEWHHQHDMFAVIESTDTSMDLTSEAFGFRLFLVNQSSKTYIFEVKLKSKIKQWEFHNQLSPNQILFLTDISHEQVQNNFEILIRRWEKTDFGTRGLMLVEKKLKPKLIYKYPVHFTWLNNNGHFLPLVFKRPKSKPNESLTDYAKSHSIIVEKEEKEMVQYETDVYKYAHFSSEIDLHIEALLGKKDFNLKADEILDYQLNEFDRFIDEAMILGIKRVFIIHGVGKGALRGHIFKRLRSNPSILNFKNEYHSNYGFGATEVNFGAS